MKQIMYYSYCQDCPFEHLEHLQNGNHPLATYHKETNPEHIVRITVQIAD